MIPSKRKIVLLLMLVLVPASCFASGRFFKISPKMKNETGFSISVVRERDGNTLIQFPAQSGHFDLREARLLIRKDNAQDNRAFPRIGIPVQSKQGPSEKTLSLSFILSDEHLRSAGILLMYGSPEKEDIYSVDLKDYLLLKVEETVSLPEALGIEKIVSATVIHSPQGFSSQEGRTTSYVTTRKTLNSLLALLSGFPSRGGVYKSWPENIAHWQIYLHGKDAKVITLNIYGRSLQSPLDATFSPSADDPKNTKLLALLRATFPPKKIPSKSVPPAAEAMTCEERLAEWNRCYEIETRLDDGISDWTFESLDSQRKDHLYALINDMGGVYEGRGKRRPMVTCKRDMLSFFSIPTTESKNRIPGVLLVAPLRRSGYATFFAIDAEGKLAYGAIEFGTNYCTGGAVYTPEAPGIFFSAGDWDKKDAYAQYRIAPLGKLEKHYAATPVEWTQTEKVTGTYTLYSHPIVPKKLGPWVRLDYLEKAKRSKNKRAKPDAAPEKNEPCR